MFVLKHLSGLKLTSTLFASLLLVASTAPAVAFDSVSVRHGDNKILFKITGVGTQVDEYSTHAGFVKLFNETCMRGFPSSDNVFNQASKLGFERLSNVQWQHDNTRVNVVHLTVKNRQTCKVTAFGLTTDGLAPALARNLKGVTNASIKYRAGGHRATIKALHNGKRVQISSGSLDNSPRYSIVEIKISEN